MMHSATYQETLDYLFSSLPMYQRIGAAAYKADLSNTHAICQLIGNPEKDLRCIHVGGTNGKGSTSHMIAAVLQAAGYRTGLYTSPHLRDFRERIRINGEMIPEEDVVRFVTRYKKGFEAISPSFFEMTVGMAFDYFVRSEVDVAVVEVGLGGRLDSTNVVTPDLSVITNISYDHMNLLGDTLVKIAGEKAGIIKKGIPVVIGEHIDQTDPVFISAASSCAAPLTFAEDKVRVTEPEMPANTSVLSFDVARNGRPWLNELRCGLGGLYQKKNVTTVLAALLSLRDSGYVVPDDAIRKGILDVSRMTGLKGRWQELAASPLTIADTGHNEAGIREVLQQLQMLGYGKLHFVLGMVSDKDVGKILALLPKDAVYYFCQARIPRAMPASDLAEAARAHGLSGEVYGSVDEAMRTAQSLAGNADVVFVGGSTFTVAEVV